MIYYKAKKDFYGMVKDEFFTYNEIKKGIVYNKGVNAFILENINYFFEKVEYKKNQMVTIFGVRQLKTI